MTAYTATTTNATNKITATAGTGAIASVTVNGKAVENGSSAAWDTGDNVLEVKVVNGAASKTYTVIMAKEN